MIRHQRVGHRDGRRRNTRGYMGSDRAETSSSTPKSPTALASKASADLEASRAAGPVPTEKTKWFPVDDPYMKQVKEAVVLNLAADYEHNLEAINCEVVARAFRSHAPDIGRVTFNRKGKGGSANLVKIELPYNPAPVFVVVSEIKDQARQLVV